MKDLKQEGKYRCKMCLRVFEVPGITYETDRMGRKIANDCCPFCPSLNFVELEKVVSHIKETPKVVREYLKLDEYKLIKLVSSLSQLDQLKVIRLVTKVYKQQKGDVYALDVVLKDSVTLTRESR